MSKDSEKLQQARFDQLVWDMAATLGTLALEVAGLVYLSRGRISPFAALSLHVVVVTLLGFWAFQRHRSNGDLRLPFLLLVSTSVLGPFGPLGTIMTVALTIWFTRDPVTVEEWYAAIFPEEEFEEDPALDKIAGAVRGGEVKAVVTPFMEIMSFGNSRQRQALVALVTKYYKPPFAPVLRRALQDQNNAVRVQAATAIAKIETNFLDRSLELQAQVRQFPGAEEPLLALASHYDDYAFSGVLDAAREKENRESACSGYRQYLELNHDNSEARLAVGRILSRQNRHREAAAWWESCRQSGFSSPEMTLWYMENLFHLKRFSELRSAAASEHAAIDSNKDLPLKMLETVTLWAGESAFIGSLGPEVE